VSLTPLLPSLEHSTYWGWGGVGGSSGLLRLEQSPLEEKDGHTVSILIYLKCSVHLLFP
jgi:hypothetical protein